MVPKNPSIGCQFERGAVRIPTPNVGNLQKLGRLQTLRDAISGFVGDFLQLIGLMQEASGRVWLKKGQGIFSGTFQRGVAERGVFAFACQYIVSPRGRTGNRTVTQVRHPLLIEWRPNCARQPLASTLSAPRVAARSYCDPGSYCQIPWPFFSRELCWKAPIVGANLKGEDFHRKRREIRRK